MSALRCVVLALPLWLPSTLVGQDSIPPVPTLPPLPALTDSTPFHRGQWALQFSGATATASLGALRFTSPADAWLVDVRLTGGHSNRRVTFPTATGDTTVEDFFSDVNVTLRIGKRHYTPRSGRLLAFHTLGVIGGFQHAAGGVIGGPGGETNGWSAGAFGDLGGSYLVTPHLSVGGAGTLTVTYAREYGRGTGGTRQRWWSYRVSTPSLAFIATVYF